MKSETPFKNSLGLLVKIFSPKSLSHFFIFKTEKRHAAGADTMVLLFYSALVMLTIWGLFIAPFTWQGCVAFLVMSIIGIIGSEVADHRYFSHKSFKTSRLGEYFLAFCSGIVLQDSLFHWATDHKAHHRYSDNQGENMDKDPHNSRKGFLFSFVGWVLLKGSDHENDMETKIRRGKGLYGDLFLNLLQFYPFIWLSLLSIFAALYLWGGLSALVYGIIGLIIIPALDMFFVNSVGHSHGPSWLHHKGYKSSDYSANVPLLGFLGSGVGWHNNHHTFPWSARAGLEWWQLDKAWIIIYLMKTCGLVWDVKVPTHQQRIDKRL